jgi:Kef-type K+ transport system membrane component KefB
VLGVMMNTRALMELVVINVGYDLGVISRQVFTMLVLMAVFSTVITTPLPRRWLPRALSASAPSATAAPEAAQ